MNIQNLIIRRILFFTVLLAFSLSLSAQDLVEVPELSRRVMDLTGTLTAGEQNALEKKLAALEQTKGSQVAVLLVPTTGDETIEQYAIRVAHDEWKLGREGVDDGVLFLIAINDRKMRIEVGYGLEGALPDAIAKRIISKVVTPEFRSGHFYDGIDSGVDVIIGAIQGEELPPAVADNRAADDGFAGWAMPVLIFGFFGSAILKGLLKKKLGNGKATLVITAITFVLGWLLAGLFIGIFISIIVAIFTGLPSGGGRGGRGGGGYWGGYGGYGRGGGGFSGGGGFGGFSGGGGGFGGGGASGGW